MLSELRRYREEGYPDAFINMVAQYRLEYIRMPLMRRYAWGFDYFLRMKYIEFLKHRRV